MHDSIRLPSKPATAPIFGVASGRSLTVERSPWEREGARSSRAVRTQRQRTILLRGVMVARSALDREVPVRFRSQVLNLTVA